MATSKRFETVTIERAVMEDMLAELRELSEGRGSHKAAAETAIRFLFEELGEPGAGE